MSPSGGKNRRNRYPACSFNLFFEVFPSMERIEGSFCGGIGSSCCGRLSNPLLPICGEPSSAPLATSCYPADRITSLCCSPVAAILAACRLIAAHPCGMSPGELMRAAGSCRLSTVLADLLRFAMEKNRDSTVNVTLCRTMYKRGHSCLILDT